MKKQIYRMQIMNESVITDHIKQKNERKIAHCTK